MAPLSLGVVPFIVVDFGLPQNPAQQADVDIAGVGVGNPNLMSSLTHEAMAPTGVRTAPSEPNKLTDQLTE